MRRSLWGLSAGACREARATTEPAAVQPLPRNAKDAPTVKGVHLAVEDAYPQCESARVAVSKPWCPRGEVRNTYLFAWNL